MKITSNIKFWWLKMINKTKKKRIEIFKTCWTSYLLMKKQMKSLNWIVRIKQKLNNELTFKRVVIESWQFEFKRKLKMLNYLKEKSVAFIENCKMSKKRDWIVHFQMNFDCWWKNKRLIIDRQTVKFSTTTTRKILMSKWLAYRMQNCSKIDTLKNKKWCRFVYVQIIVWMMLSIVMRKVWIDWFWNYERQNVNLYTLIANQLSDHHSFNMKRRQNSCQMFCKNIRSNFKSFNLILCHNKNSLNDQFFAKFHFFIYLSIYLFYLFIFSTFARSL